MSMSISTVKVQPRERKNVTLGYLERGNKIGFESFLVHFYSKTLPCSLLPVKSSLSPSLNLFTTLTVLEHEYESQKLQN